MVAQSALAGEARRDTTKRVLMFVPDAALTGGVISFLETLLAHFGDTVSAERFVVGRRRDGWRAGIGPLVVLVDLVRLARTVRRERFDLIHANPSLNGQALLRDGAFLLLLRLMRAGPVCVFMHGWDCATERRLARSRLLRFLFRHSFGRADRVFVLASRFQDALIDLGLDPAAVTVTTTMFSQSDVHRAGRSRSQAQTLLFMARFVPEKGVHEVLEAFAELRSRGHPLTLVLAGSGPEEARLKQWVAGHSLQDHVRFPGYVRGQAKADLLESADAFLLPTYHGEGCPVAVLEAMAAGLPVVTTAEGGIPDVIEDGQNGLILPDVSPAEIVRAVEALMESPALVERMGRVNRREAWSRYEASVVTRQIEAAYDRL